MTERPADKRRAARTSSPVRGSAVGASASTERLLARKVARKLRARANDPHGVWAGLGMMGRIGWSVVVPTLLGAALGRWLDRHVSSDHSWTLALLATGLVLGCFNAWRWVAQQELAIRAEQEDDHD